MSAIYTIELTKKWKIEKGFESLDDGLVYLIEDLVNTRNEEKTRQDNVSAMVGSAVRSAMSVKSWRINLLDGTVIRVFRVFPDGQHVVICLR